MTRPPSVSAILQARPGVDTGLVARRAETEVTLTLEQRWDITVFADGVASATYDIVGFPELRTAERRT